jgi:hypothetical protein
MGAPNGGGPQLAMLGQPARQLVERLVAQFPGAFRTADFDADLAAFINDHMPLAVQLFRDILEGRNTFVHRSNIRKMAGYIISEIKSMKRGRP